MLITVAAFREPWEAHMFCARLKAEGVPAVVNHEHHVGLAWHLSVLLGGVKVQVPDARKDDAWDIERLCRDGAFQSLLEGAFGDIDDVHCPHCGSDEYWKRRPLLRAALAISVSLPFGTVLPPLGWVYFCEKCDTKFKRPLCPNTIGKSLLILAAVATDLILLCLLALLLWIAGTKYWFIVAVIIIMFAAKWAIARLSTLENAQD